MNQYSRQATSPVNIRYVNEKYFVEYPSFLNTKVEIRNIKHWKPRPTPKLMLAQSSFRR